MISCDEKSKKKFQTCTDSSECGDNQTCAGIGEDRFVCLDVCDPAASNACGDNMACLPARGTFVCTPTCDPGDAGACGEGWVCAPYGNTGMCLETCSLDDGECTSPDAVCVPWENGTAVCVDACDRENPDTCPAGRVCELRTDALTGCYLPVFFNGDVTDAADGDPIAQAHVLAADATGAMATNVAVTNEQGRYQLQVPVTRNPDGTEYYKARWWVWTYVAGPRHAQPRRHAGGRHFHPARLGDGLPDVSRRHPPVPAHRRHAGSFRRRWLGFGIGTHRYHPHSPAGG